MSYDYIIVGAGLFGATVARELTDAKKKVLVLEKSDRVAGMCRTEVVDGIITQRHAGHIFHTNDKRLWDYVQRFACFRQYSHHVKARNNGRTYSFPINLMTFQQVYGDNMHTVSFNPHPAGESLKDWAISAVGQELYELFIEGYTWKQWGRDPAELPPSIIRRIPVRKTWNDEYFDDAWQGLPESGYTPMIEAMLHGIPVALGEDYNSRQTYWNFRTDRVIYSGPIDALFGRMLGRLEYRSLRFEWERLEVEDYQGCPTMNYTGREVEFTRVHEHKHYYPAPVPHTVISREFPVEFNGENEAYYPVNDAVNQHLYEQYAHLARRRGIICGGRLGGYRYLDMHQVIAQALTVARGCLN